MIAGHLLGFSLAEDLSESIQLVGNAHSELVVGPITVEGFYEYLYLAPYLLPLYSCQTE